jgi:GTP pyrophosphokinase
MKERAEVAAIGSKLFDEIAARVPARIGKKAIRAAVERLGMEEPDDLMYAIGAAKIADREVMEALVPGCTADIEEDEHWERRERAISIRGLTPGVAFELAPCCHPVPGDRIVGIRRKGEPVLVHAIDCMELANGIDSDWIDLAWGNRSFGAAGQLSVTIYDRLGTLAEMAGIFAQNKANIITLMQAHIDHPFVTYDVEVEVEDAAHLNRIISALRASDAVAQAERQ